MKWAIKLQKEMDETWMNVILLVCIRYVNAQQFLSYFDS